MKILGLCGYAGAGKDHVFDYLKEHSEIMHVRRVAFADGVRDEVAETFGIADWHSDPAFQKPYSEGVRFVLQRWGTEFRRAQDDLYWVKRGIEKAYDLEKTLDADEFGLPFKGTPEHYLLVVFTDVRFENEAVAIQQAGGRVLQVMASLPVRIERLGGVPAEGHASEVIDFFYDGVVTNNRDGDIPVLASEDRAWLGMGLNL